MQANAYCGVLTPMATGVFQDIREGLRQLYVEDDWPWLVGSSGGKDCTMLATGHSAIPTTKAHDENARSALCGCGAAAF